MFKSPFTATKLQVATYLLGIALFSISFLVFLNASVSFVVTDLIGQKEHVGDAVGTLGFADELVALVACPFWGLISDRLGLRTVAFVGYAIVGISLFVFVQAKNVYPDLLLARLFFSIGGAATATMVTAILPTMTVKTSASRELDEPTPLRETTSPARSATSQIAGFVGMFTGLGALVALGAFLPLPTRFQQRGRTPASAVTDSFYVVGAISLAVSVFCALGLAGLAGEEGKGWRALFGRVNRTSTDDEGSGQKVTPYSRQLLQSLKLGFTDVEIGLGYLGGFVARASSVAISLFIPVYVNAYFISSGLCKDGPHTDPHDIKEQCKRAYSVAAALSGVSQLIALICAPLFGYLDGRFTKGNVPLLVAALAGMVGYVVLAQLKSPDPSSEHGGPAIFLVMALLGISQIGAIVCSLSSLGRGIQGGEENRKEQYYPAIQTTGAGGVLQGGEESMASERNVYEDAPLLNSNLQRRGARPASRSHLKGSIAGVYSLAGGAGILLLTKLGGALFDSLSTGAPFYILAIFNAILLLVGLVCGFVQRVPTEARS